MQSYSTCLFSLISSACNQPGMKAHNNQTSFPIPPPRFASWMTLSSSYPLEGPLLARSPQPPRRRCKGEGDCLAGSGRSIKAHSIQFDLIKKTYS